MVSWAICFWRECPKALASVPYPLISVSEHVIGESMCCGCVVVGHLPLAPEGMARMGECVAGVGRFRMGTQVQYLLGEVE